MVYNNWVKYLQKCVKKIKNMQFSAKIIYLQRRHMSSRWEGVLLFDILSSVSSQIDQICPPVGRTASIWHFVHHFLLTKTKSDQDTLKHKINT